MLLSKRSAVIFMVVLEGPEIEGMLLQQNDRKTI